MFACTHFSVCQTFVSFNFRFVISTKTNLSFVLLVNLNFLNLKYKNSLSDNSITTPYKLSLQKSISLYLSVSPSSSSKISSCNNIYVCLKFTTIIIITIYFCFLLIKQLKPHHVYIYINKESFQ